MSTLGKSIVRGFGFAVGAQMAKSVMSTPVNYNSRILGISTKRQLIAVLLWIVLFVPPFYMGKNDYGFFGLNLLFGLPVQVLIQYVLQKNSDKKQEKAYHEEGVNQYEIAMSLAKKENVNVSELVLKDKTSSYNLYKFAELITNKVNRTNKFRGKYSGEELQNIVERKVWIGMTIENLTDMFGQPNQIEVEENSRSKYETLIYGKTKRSGDVYTFRNGQLKEYKDR